MTGNEIVARFYGIPLKEFHFTLVEEIDTAIVQAVAAERQRCAAILREHICNYCDHDHAEYMAQLVLEGTP